MAEHETSTDNNLAWFRERAKTELAETGGIGRIAWDCVVEDLCNEVERLRSVSKKCGDAAKLREVVKKVLDAVKHLSRTHNDNLPEDVRAVLEGIAFDANAALAATETAEKSLVVGDCAKLHEDSVSLECQVKPLSLDEAIAHADDVAGDCSTGCKREHKQLANWLRELKKRRNGSDDAAKLREALSDACYAMFNFLKTQNGGYEEMANALDKAKAALAAPAINCEVGTVEEQSERFRTYCEEHKDNDAECLYCPLFGKTGGHCELAWAQLPYTEGGTE